MLINAADAENHSHFLFAGKTEHQTWRKSPTDKTIKKKQIDSISMDTVAVP